MKKRNLITALTIGTAIALAVAGCGKKSEKTSGDVKATENTTVYEEITAENGSQPEEETKADTGDKILDALIDAGYDKDTEYETDDNGTIFVVEDGKKTEVETDKDANIVPVKDDGKADKETKPEKETKNNNKADNSNSNKTDNKPAATKPAENKPATPKSITVKVSGTHYVGDTLSGSDFTVTVTMSDGSTLTNPAGWSASPLKLSAESNKITVSYSGISSDITVKASKKAAAKPTENKPAAPAKTYSSDYEKHFIENGGKYKTNSDGTVTIISGGIDGSGKLMIPAKIDGKRVKDVDHNVRKFTDKWGDFYLTAYDNSNADGGKYDSGIRLTSLYIEEGSTMDLGEDTFIGLNYCTYVYIPKSITKIPSNGWLSLAHPVQKCKVIVNHPVETWQYGWVMVDDIMDGSDRCAVWLDVVYSD